MRGEQPDPLLPRDQKLHNLLQALESAKAHGRTQEVPKLEFRIRARQEYLRNREAARIRQRIEICGLPLWG